MTHCNCYKGKQLLCHHFYLRWTDNLNTRTMSFSLGTEIVGFVVQTHIQARVSDRSGDFQLAQLDRAVTDIQRFRDKESVADKEIVCFDILSGDLNFDSVSDSDKTRWAHPLFSEYYVDPCR